MIMSLNKIRDIKKALSCCSEAKNCNNCPYKEDPMCQDQLNKDALEVIVHYEEEINDLEEYIDKQYEQAKADILGNMSDGGTSCHWCIEQHRLNAFKEFAEKLLNNYATYRLTEEISVDAVVCDIKCLVNKMEGK